MKGNNELKLCMSELCTAVEFYLNEKLFKQPVKVESVLKESGVYEFGFVVKLTDEVCDTPDTSPVVVQAMRDRGYPEYEGQNHVQFINSIGSKAEAWQLKHGKGDLLCRTS